MNWTDRHARRFWRLCSRDVLLYTEMVTAQAILFSRQKQRLIGFSQTEQPVALQIAGSKPEELADASRIGEEFGYREINLNVGCPSKRVQEGRFGSCLMKEPQLVQDCIAAMAQAVRIPVTVKCRIGVDQYASYSFLEKFVEIVKRAPCPIFIIHARVALLDGLSPKQNRTVPPLRYADVYRLKRDFPDLQIVINGGIQTSAEVRQHLQHTDGVMLGREIYHNPYILVGLQQEIQATNCAAVADNSEQIPARAQLLTDFLPYIEEQLSLGVKLNQISRHLLGLFQNCPNGRLYRRHISQHAHKPNAGTEVLLQALALVQRDNMWQQNSPPTANEQLEVGK